MNRWQTLRLYGAGSILLPAAALVIWQEYSWLIAVFVAWTIMAAALWVIADRRIQSERSERTAQALQMTAIRTLNHHRHDWMNDLQVLYGYIRMNKLDKTVDCVEKIRERMTVESRIAKLGIPSLVLYLQSFRTITNSMQLLVEAADDINLAELPLDGERTAEALIDAINGYRFAVKPSSGEAARLTVTMHRDERYLHVLLQYEGELLNAEELHEKFKQRFRKTVLRVERLEPDMREAALRAELNG